MAEDQRANRNVSKEGGAYIEPHGRQNHSHQCHGRCWLWRWASGAVHDQIVTTNISAGGDSDSLVVTLDNIAVGLLFTGSSVATIVNQIENVRALLRVEVAEQIL